jgi:hypothetical protein
MSKHGKPLVQRDLSTRFLGGVGGSSSSPVVLPMIAIMWYKCELHYEFLFYRIFEINKNAYQALWVNFIERRKEKKKNSMQQLIIIEPLSLKKKN